MKCFFQQCVVVALLAFSTTGITLAAEEGETSDPKPAPTIQQQLEEQQQRIAELERLLKQQGEILQALQAHLSAQNGTPAANSASASAPTAQGATSAQEMERLSGEVGALAENTQALNEKVDELDQKTSETENRLSAKLKGLGNFSFGGDLRLRYEPFRGGTSADRNRTRFRARLDIRNKLSDEWSAGLRVATGDETDPISTNQSFTDFYQRKAFNIDRAYLVYTPNWFAPLTLTGGKFAYTWNNTELTFDGDLNPEGLSPALSFKLKDGPLQNVKLVGYALPFRESGSGGDSYMMGGSVETGWKLGSRASFEASASFSNWFRTDAIRAAESSSSLSGSLNLNASSATAFASRFGLLDLIAELNIDTGAERWPLMLLFDYVTNTRACSNVSIAGVACNPNDRQGYWTEIAVGSTSSLHGFKAGYTLIHIEREAVLGTFSFSDLRQATDVVNHRFSFAYQAFKNITLGYTLLVGRQLGSDEPWLKRSQIDTIYKF